MIKITKKILITCVFLLLATGVFVGGVAYLNAKKEYPYESSSDAAIVGPGLTYDIYCNVNFKLNENGNTITIRMLKGRNNNGVVIILPSKGLSSTIVNNLLENIDTPNYTYADCSLINVTDSIKNEVNEYYKKLSVNINETIEFTGNGTQTIGIGVVESDFYIGSRSDLEEMRSFVNNGSTSTDGYLYSNTYKLIDDIDMGGKDNPWTEGIGTLTNPFTGTFDGQGYTISNLFINNSYNFSNSGDRVGLFGCVQAGELGNTTKITNLNLDTFKVYISGGQGNTESNISDYVGVLCGEIYSGYNSTKPINNIEISNISAYANESVTSSWIDDNGAKNYAVFVRDTYWWNVGWLPTYRYGAPQSAGGLIGCIDTGNSRAEAYGANNNVTIKNIIYRGNVAAEISTQGSRINVGGIVGFIGNYLETTNPFYNYASGSIDANPGEEELAYLKETNPNYSYIDPKIKVYFYNCLYEGSLSVANDQGREIAVDSDDSSRLLTVGGICGVMFRPATFVGCVSQVKIFKNPGLAYSSYEDWNNRKPESFGSITAGYIVLTEGAGIAGNYGYLFFTEENRLKYNYVQYIPSGVTGGFDWFSIDGDILCNCSSNAIETENDLTNKKTYDDLNSVIDPNYEDLIINITEETNEQNNFNKNAEWFINSKINGGYPIPMTLLRIKDYTLNFKIEGEVEQFTINGVDIIPTQSGDIKTYSCTVPGSAVYTIEMAPNYNLNGRAFYYLGTEYIIKVDSSPYNQVGPTTNENSLIIEYSFTRQEVTFYFNKSGSTTLDGQTFGWEISSYTGNLNSSGSSLYYKQLLVGTKLFFTENSIVAYKWNTLIEEDQYGNITNIDGELIFTLYYQYDDRCIQCKNYKSSDSDIYYGIYFDTYTLDKVIEVVYRSYEDDYAGYEYITPQFEFVTYVLSDDNLSFAIDPDYGQGNIDQDLMGEFTINGSLSGFYNLKLTASGNEIKLKYDSFSNTQATITANPNDNIFEQNVSKWQYLSAEDNNWHDIPTTGVEIYKVGALRAYVTPVEYQLKMNYNSAQQTNYDSVFSNIYNIISNEIDLNICEIDSSLIPKGKVFGGWLLLNQGTYTYSDVNYKIEQDSNLEIVIVKDNNGYGQWAFNYSGIYTAIDGKSYYLLDKFIPYYNKDIYSFGDLNSTNTSDPLIRVYWSNTYNVEILNEAINTLWAGNDLNSSYKYAGVNNELNGTTNFKPQNKINIQISFNKKNQYPFASSVSSTGTGISMYTLDDFTRQDSVSKINGSNYFYYVYAYGYKISAWTISFMYEDITYYLICEEEQNDPGNLTWSYTTTSYSNDIGSLLNSSTNDLAFYADDLDILFMGMSQTSTITMTPVWEAVNIEPISSAGSGTSFAYNSNYNLESMFVNDLSQLGMSIAYFSSSDNSWIALSGTWNYYNLKNDQFSYDSTYDKYTIKLSPQYTDNIYKVILNGISSAELDENYTNYAQNNSENVPTENKYTFKDFGYTTYTSGYIETYINDELKGYVNTYISSIGNSPNYYAKQIYTDGSNTYIYLANNRSVGELPVYTTGNKILIAWNNSTTNEDSKKYSYLTSAYDEDIHKNLANLYIEVEVNGVWTYSQVYDGTNNVITFDPFFYRKSFNLDMNILYNNIDTNVGYVILQVDDKDETTNLNGKYLFVNQIDGNKTELLIYDISNISNFSLDSYMQSSGKVLVTDFFLYADCDFTFTTYDQSKDIASVNENYRDTMLGYRLDSISSQSFNNMYDNSENRYEYKITAEDIFNNNYQNGATLDFIANFTKINYTTSVRLDNADAGYLNIYLPDGTMLTRITNSEAIDFVVDDQIKIEYIAYIGYEFKENTIIIEYSNNVINLVTDSEMINQQYTFFLNASWLQNNYYRPYDNTYSVPSTRDEKVDIGALKVQTQLIEFDVKVKLYNGTNELDEIYLKDENYTWSLDDASINLKSLFSSTGRIDGRDIYGLIYADNKYAIISSWLYIPKRPTDTRNYYTTYAFPNYEISTRDYIITSDLLASMVITGSGEIVPIENRTIYFSIEVYEQYEITAQVKALDHDTNSTNRSTTISATSRIYVNTLNLTGNSTIDESTNMYTTMVHFYTYEGLIFALNSSYDSKRYSGVEYEYDGTKIENSIAFTKDNISENKNGTLTISFIPKNLQVTKKYYIEDDGNIAEISETEVANIVKVILSSDEYIYVDSEIGISITPVDTKEFNKYNLSVSVGIDPKENISNENQKSNDKFIGSHIVSDSVDYAAGEVVVNITLQMKSHDSVNLTFALTDEEYWTGESTSLKNTRSLADDEYGSITLYVDGEEVTESGFSIIAGQKVEVEVNLNFGYTLRGYRKNIGSIQAVSTARFTLTEHFDATENVGDGGYYTIFISKDLYDAVLTIGENTLKNYQIESSGSIKTQNADQSIIRLNNIYIGKTITFNQIREIENERLDHYYYKNKDNEEITIILNNNELKIDENILANTSDDEINFGVVTIKRYKLEINTTVGESLIGDITTSLPIKEENGKVIYYDAGTSISVKITTIQPGKYIINLLGSIVSSGFTINVDIVLDKDKNLEVQITPDSYSVSIDEYVYSNIGDLNTGANKTDDMVSALESSAQYYNSKASISVKLEGDNRILTSLHFVSGDVAYELNVKDNQLTCNRDGAVLTDEKLIITIGDKVYEYEITIINGRLVISYTSMDDINLSAYYTELKDINPA